MTVSGELREEVVRRVQSGATPYAVARAMGIPPSTVYRWVSTRPSTPTADRPYKRPGRAPCSVDGCGQPYYCKSMCVMHYNRMHLLGDVGGPERLRGLPGDGALDGYGYRVLYLPDHPLARHQGKVKEHRVVLYDAIGPGPHTCHWCACAVDWNAVNGHGGLCVDHLDHNKVNNVLSNLVPSCLDCNAKRRAPKAAA